jgi:outer membrane murein-binding lipoprotein Lpp
MARLRTQAAWLIRGSDRTNAAVAEIQQLRLQLDELRSEMTALRSELEAAREENRGSVADLTARVGSVSERLEGLGG